MEIAGMSKQSAKPICFCFLSAIIYPWWDIGPAPRVHRFRGVIEGRLSHFLPRWLRTGWQSVISQGKTP